MLYCSMAIIFIDYTNRYHREVTDSVVPALVRGKFIQIMKAASQYLVFSPTEFTKYHANIVERFCMDKGIEGRYDAERKRFDIYDTAWTIVGGGKFEIDRARKTIKLHDDSLAYGKFDKAGLADAILSLSGFSGFTIQVE